jgi:hypothetical protein
MKALQPIENKWYSYGILGQKHYMKCTALAGACGLNDPQEALHYYIQKTSTFLRIPVVYPNSALQN